MTSRICADGLLRQVERVGAHVGDQAHLALADVDAFVELLRDAHGLLRAEAQLARGFLLQGRGRERRRRIALALLAVHRQDGELALGRLVQRALDLARLRFGGEAELLDLGAPVFDQLARETSAPMLELGIDGPVLPRHEGGDLVLALADHAQRRDSARGRPTGPGAPSSTAAARD